MDKRKISLRTAALALFAFVTVQYCRADWITLKDGRREQGIVLEANESIVRIERQSGRLTIPVSEIQSIERQSSADNAVLQAEYSFDEEKAAPETLFEAVRAYAQACDSGATTETLCSSMLPVLNYLMSSEEASREPASEELANLLTRLSSSVPTTVSPDFFSQASLFLSRMGRTAEAMDLFLKAPPEAHQINFQWRRELSKSVAQNISRMIASGQTEAALEQISLLGRIDPDQGESNRPWAMLAKADLLGDAGTYQEAIDLYASEVAPAYPEIAKNRTINLLRDAVEAARVDGNFLPVVGLTTGSAVDLLGRSLAENLQADVYRDWGLWRLDRGDYEGAEECMRNHYVFAPGPDEILLDLVEYRKRASQIAETDFESHYELGVFCLEAKLTEQAKEQFRLAQNDEDWGKLARKQLDDLEIQHLENLLAQARELKDEGRYREAREKTLIVIKETKDPELREIAERFHAVIIKSMEYIHKRAPIEAEVLWQNAERCLLPAESQRCLELLNEILREYPDTPAAKRAIQRRKMLLEAGFRDTAQRIPAVTKSIPAASRKADDEMVDPVRLQEEMLKLQQSIETVAAQ